MKKSRINNVVVVSDLHCGCQFGLCPPGPIGLEGGGSYRQSRPQAWVWKQWLKFWRDWVPQACHGEDYAIVINGDALDGVHHGSVSQITHNLSDQTRILKASLQPILHPNQKLFWISGTEAHVGPSGQDEERAASLMGAIPDQFGNCARHELWLNVGNGLCHFLHTISTTNSAAYESTAVMKELVDAYTESGRNRLRSPDVEVRSHRHRHLEVRVPTALGYGISFVTPGWQLKTPFVYRTAGGRAASAQVGGSVIRQGDRDLYTRHWVRSAGRPKVVQI